MINRSTIETIVRADRVIVLLGLVGLAVMAWMYTVHLAVTMQNMDSAAMDMAHRQQWNLSELFVLFLMWVIMMIAMMIPSTLPMVLMYASTLRRKFPQHGILIKTAGFVLGYLVAWTAFSAVITLVQWGFHQTELLSAMMVSTSDVLGGVLLIVAGVYQWTSLKQACLRYCRSPLGFLMTEWREGTGGALLMGIRHGLFCVGCCWALMGLLFVAGVMNILWIAIIAIFVLLEKIIPAGESVAKCSGLLLIGWGVLMAGGVFSI